jgi:hypothetical protein
MIQPTPPSHTRNPHAVALSKLGASKVKGSIRKAVGREVKGQRLEWWLLF